MIAENIQPYNIHILENAFFNPLPQPPPPSLRSYPWHDLIISFLMYKKLSKIFPKKFVPLSAIKITIFQKNSAII